MYFSTAVVATLSLLPIFAVPKPLITVTKYNDNLTGRHIVSLRPGVTPISFLKATNITAIYKYTVINGFASVLSASTLDMLRAHPDVTSISEDGINYPGAVQNDAVWGLSRLSSARNWPPNPNPNPNDGNFQFIYGEYAGAGVDIYVVDTGVNVNHVDFGGRARWGAVFGGGAARDVHGHGTHCAGTAAGTRYGVAKEAAIIAVRVTQDNGFSTTTDTLAGFDWILGAATISGRPSVVSYSMYGPPSDAIDAAVVTLTNRNLHVAVCAGNDNTNAVNFSPGRVPAVITVGASNIFDARWVDSNFGAVVDIFAPGEHIWSTGIASDVAATVMSGTSMATPHISGLIATIISTRGQLSPAEMSERLKDIALLGVLQPNTIPAGTNNILAQT